MRAVAVHLPRRVPVAQDVVAHHLRMTEMEIEGMIRLKTELADESEES